VLKKMNGNIGITKAGDFPYKNIDAHNYSEIDFLYFTNQFFLWDNTRWNYSFSIPLRLVKHHSCKPKSSTNRYFSNNFRNKFFSFYSFFIFDIYIKKIIRGNRVTA